jgi:O-antigen ligase
VSFAGRLRAALVFLFIYLLFTSWLPERIYYSVFQVGILLLTGWWILYVTRLRLPVAFPWPVSAMFVFPLWGLFQLAAGQSVYAWKTAIATLDWTVFACAGWLTCQLFVGRQPQLQIRQGLAVLGTFIGTLSVAHWYSSPGMILWTIPNPYAFRVCFPLLNHSHFAALEELALGPAVWLAMQSRKRPQFYIGASALMACAVFATGSRSGSAIVAVEVAVLLVLNLRLVRDLQMRKRAVVLAVVTLVLIAGAGWQELASRIASPPRDLRAFFAASTIDMVKTKPVAGYGLGTWDTVYPAFARVDPRMFVEHAHDDWLEWAAEGGIPFALAMLLLAGFALRYSVREPWCFGIFAAFVQSSIEFSMHKPALVALQFAALGCLAASRSSQIADLS